MTMTARAGTERVDVVVVGAGLAGLVCARRLLQAGLRVALLEADGRIGGRAHGTEAGGACFDLGGQWVGPGQERVLALIDELGLSTFLTANEGRHLLSVGGRLRTYRGTIPLISPRALLELGRATAHTYGASWLLPADLRPNHRTAHKDARSVEDLAGRLRTPEARALFDAAFRTVFGAEPRDVSLLFYLAYVRAGGGFFHLVDVQGGAQERRLQRGVYGLAAALAAPLGDALRLGAPVRRIAADGDGVEVSGDGFAVRGRRAVVTVPPQLRARIAFDPPLPADRTALLAGCRMGSAVKVHALYPGGPFWRDRGLSGQAVCGEGPLSVLFDNTSHDGRQAALVGFVMGDEARRFGARDPEERRRAILDQLAHLFGREGGAAAELLVHDWTQEAWTGGCPVASPPPGVLHGRAGALRAPHGPVHFAGTETAARYPGYLDGAVSSGERAAAEVLRGHPPAAATGSARCM